MTGDTADLGHYVYLYRDQQRRPMYVGYGARPTRATAHLIESHNPGFANFLESSKFSIEVAGPFTSEEKGRMVETAVISALNPRFNVALGSSSARFRPIGVPIEFADRVSAPPLMRADFFTVQTAAPVPVLLVSVGVQDFDDGRVGYDLADPPTDDQVRERTDRWWQLQKYVAQWTAIPSESPGLLLGVHGAPGAQLIIASLLVNRNGWAAAESYPGGGGKISVPLLQQDSLDAFGLRGRRIHRDADIAFEGVPSGFFAILHPDGRLLGGRRKRR